MSRFEVEAQPLSQLRTVDSFSKIERGSEKSL